jgi:LysM domain
MKRKAPFKALLLIESCLLLVKPAFANTSLSPQQETASIAKSLRPIPDDQWKEIAGARISESYAVTQGDTLSDISKRLFGDAKYWPKVWAINNGAITNPHYILPGKAVAFLPGTGTSLPSLGVSTAENTAVNPSEGDDLETDDEEPTMNDAGGQVIRPKKSQEWKNLPRQDWENVSVRLPPEVDPLGFDRRSKINSKATNTTFDLDLIAASKKVDGLGLIIAAEDESNTITNQEIVFVSSKNDLQIGDRYAISESPFELKNKVSPRVGYSYGILGSVRIVDRREGLYVGIVENARHPFYRGAMLLPLPPRVRADLEPIPAPNSIEGILHLDRFYSTRTTAQHKLVFVDRGTDDGVQVGMVFRVYQHFDSNNDLRITKGNVLISADLIVVQTSEKFSTCYVLSSSNYIVDGTPVTLLTDISDLTKANPDHRRIEMNNNVNSIDELDRLDNGIGLGEDEKRELKQLEKYKNEPETAPTEAPPAPEMPPNPEEGELTPGSIAPPVTAPQPPSEMPPAPPLLEGPSPKEQVTPELNLPGDSHSSPRSNSPEEPSAPPPPSDNSGPEDIPAPQ